MCWYLDRMPDLVACLGSGGDMHEVGAAMASRRFNSIVKPFVGAHLAEMHHLLHITSSLITGSCARCMLTSNSMPPKDLNVITGNGSAEVLYSFLVSDLRYERIDHGTGPHHAFAKEVKSFTIFRKGLWVVTVSEAKGDNLFAIVASSPTTADMTVMTPSGLVVFYPLWTLKGITLMNDFLEEECGKECPTLWRNVSDDGEHVLLLEWDERAFHDCLAAGIALSEFILSVQPKEQLMSSATAPTAYVIDYPRDTTAGGSDYAALAGVLYATRAETAELVSVPLRDGVENLVNINQLEVTHWVDLLGPNNLISTMGWCRKTYNVIGHVAEGLSPPGYTFFREHPLIYSPPNVLIRRICGITSDANDIMGNVLVVKHRQGDKNDVIDCEEDDIPWISRIIKQYV
ncbi:hypothetical protein EDD22DRAFT_845635 [Suillus occidentalis]|nr:hypothetical protein EDD22DRAFT_845635 [Suillus occidentalis]